jgi:hypothetical protein
MYFYKKIELLLASVKFLGHCNQIIIILQKEKKDNKNLS